MPKNFLLQHAIGRAKTPAGPPSSVTGRRRVGYRKHGRSRQRRPAEAGSALMLNTRGMRGVRGGRWARWIKA